MRSGRGSLAPRPSVRRELVGRPGRLPASRPDWLPRPPPRPAGGACRSARPCLTSDRSGRSRLVLRLPAGSRGEVSRWASLGVGLRGALLPAGSVSRFGDLPFTWSCAPGTGRGRRGRSSREPGRPAEPERFVDAEPSRDGRLGDGLSAARSDRGCACRDVRGEPDSRLAERDAEPPSERLPADACSPRSRAPRRGSGSFDELLMTSLEQRSAGRITRTADKTLQRGHRWVAPLK
jgi:hypothetical protein